MNEIKLGDVTVARVEEWHGPIMPADQFFPEIPEQLWQQEREILAPDHLGADDSMIQVAMQSWLLRSEGKTILIDTAVGNDKTRPDVPFWDHQNRDYLGNLAAAGVRPEDVDVVINTHLHVDHIGWNTRLDGDTWVPTFPNAVYLLPRVDFEFWNPANNPDIPAGSNEHHGFRDSIAPLRDAGRIQLWEESGHVLDGNLRLESAPGHTPGSGVIKLSSGNDQALFAGDLLHTPLQVAHPQHNSCFCHDPAVARATRRKLLGWAADNGALVLPAHISGHSAFEVEHDSDDFAIKAWGPFSSY
jgi:glyoxylase-like metal-dependent hydrolase (beta-lactamase superfamily II)